MHHVSLPVAEAPRAQISGRSTSTAAPSAPIAPADPSGPHCERGIRHPQGTLSAVQNPTPPIERRPTPSPSARQTPRSANDHVRSGVSFVPSRFDESAAVEAIEKMTSGASGLLDAWPLDGLMKLLPTIWGTRTTQPKEVENTPQPANDFKDTAENAYKSLQEEDMMNYKAPPPYHPVID